ncbi:MarR family winged helix-turn-helix transcriptional regulator [Salipiger thiooxidans]|uniref:MarR family winged helix-turn-helix transcriptional regulator n=1 Tax=Salipiger thiooxidans TaxID=282683 RepID=UPI001CD5B587|nr:MarR family winged helix-turn-helix transcriptional regulator [Salipiger thiooxidans]MCA0850421.1 MarR family winged helix-turn-helix transcriptional regulator [Salipiger thiooxidans]
MTEFLDRLPGGAYPIAFQIHLLNLRLSGQARAIIARHGDLTLPQWRIIRLIGLDPSQGSTAHRKALGFDKSQFSKTVATLVERGYIETQPHPTDKRQFIPVLTGKGHLALNKLEPELDRRQAHLLSALTPEEQRMIAPMLEKLFAAGEATEFDAPAAAQDDNQGTQTA